MRILDRFGVKWRDAGRDIILIVVSILIAFAVDAWWGRALERQAERAQVRLLIGELQAGRELLDATLDGLEGAAAANETLLSLMNPEAEGPETERLLSLFGLSLNVGFRDVRASVLDQVLASRNPIIASDSTLMLRLEAWKAAVVDLALDAGHLERNRDVDIQAALIDTGFPGFAVASSEFLGLPGSSFPLEPRDVVRDPGVYAAFYYRAFRLRLVSGTLKELIGLADSIVTELEGR